MLGLTAIGIFHTLASLAAVIAGAMSLVRDKEILPTSRLGQLYITATVIVCLSGFFIFQHGGFGKPHVLAVLTLCGLAIAAAARLTSIFGWGGPYVETVAYSLTFFFHTIPGLTETVTRLPLGAPLVNDPDNPILQMAFGIFFLLFLVGAVLQVLRLRAATRTVWRYGH